MHPFFNDITKLHAVIFDMDGVIFDSESVWAMFDEKADRIFGTGFDKKMRQSFCGMDENTIRTELTRLLPKLDVAAYREYIINGVKEYEKKYGARLKPYAADILLKLKEKNIKIALATSSRYERAKYLFDSADLTLNIFDAVMCRENVIKAKPDPEIFIKAAEAMNVKAKNTVVVEDSINGIKAAIAGGFVPLMAIDLIPPPEELLSPPTSLTTVNSLKEAAELFGV